LRHRRAGVQHSLARVVALHAPTAERRGESTWSPRWFLRVLFRCIFPSAMTPVKKYDDPGGPATIAAQAGLRNSQESTAQGRRPKITYSRSLACRSLQKHSTILQSSPDVRPSVVPPSKRPCRRVGALDSSPFMITAVARCWRWRRTSGPPPPPPPLSEFPFIQSC
jgi:hypothetical protein